MASHEVDFEFEEDVLVVNGCKYKYCEMTDSITEAGEEMEICTR